MKAALGKGWKWILGLFMGLLGFWYGGAFTIKADAVLEEDN